LASVPSSAAAAWPPCFTASARPSAAAWAFAATSRARAEGLSLLPRNDADEAYVARVVRGEIDDPTLTVQLRRGYHVYGMIPDYLEDPSSANYGVFVIWRNPDRPLVSG
jgi:hypothetical protein